MIVAGEKRSTERERERERLSLCYFFRHKSRTRRPVIEPRPVFEMPATDWLTLLYSYTHRERLVCLIIYSTCLFKVISSYEQHVKCLSLKSRLSNQTIFAVNISQKVSSYTHKLAVRKHTRGHYKPVWIQDFSFPSVTSPVSCQHAHVTSTSFSSSRNRFVSRDPASDTPFWREYNCGS